MSPQQGLSLVLVLFALAAALAAFRRAGRWRAGGPARVDWRRGLAALPRRYLVDVHHVVARDPYAARMHALLAGGLLAGSGLGVLAILPGLGTSRPYWGLVALLFAAMLAGGGMVGARRYPVRPPRLSGGRFQVLPFLLLGYGLGAFLAALDGAWPGAPALGWTGVVLAAACAAGLALQVAKGPLRHAFAGAVNLVAHPRPERFKGGKSTALMPLDLAANRLGCETPADFAWNRLASFDACIQCGRCEVMCPAFAAGQPLNPKRLIQDLVTGLAAQDARAYKGSPHPGRAAPALAGDPGGPLVGALIDPDTLWSCTTCRACVEECPMMIEHVDAVIALRRFETLEKGAVPPKAAEALAELRLADDPAGRSPAARTDFAAGLPVPVLAEGAETDVLLWLGEGAYDLRYGRTLRALLKLFAQAGVDFAVLGPQERDCGDLARRLGDEATFQRLARENIATLGRRRFRRIVTADPHAFHVLRNEYPALGGHWEVLHHTGFLDLLAAQGRLQFGDLKGLAVAYHDPCYLGRYNGGFEAPRRLLAGAGARLDEAERSGPRAMCCGGGGGAPVSDVPGKARIADLRMAQLARTGAAVVAVACPGCTAMLDGVVGERPEVLDVAELLLKSLEAA